MYTLAPMRSCVCIKTDTVITVLQEMTHIRTYVCTYIHQFTGTSPIAKVEDFSAQQQNEDMSLEKQTCTYINIRN